MAGRAVIRVIVDSGVCGFITEVTAERVDRWTVQVRLNSECERVRMLGRALSRLDMKELLSPMDRNPVYRRSGESGLHPGCLTPSGIIKASEIELDLALGRNAGLRIVDGDSD